MKIIKSIILLLSFLSTGSAFSRECENNLCILYKASSISPQGICEKEVKIEKTLYLAFKRIMKDLSENEGEVPPDLTPAQQSMLPLYSTLMENAKDTKCLGR